MDKELEFIIENLKSSLHDINHNIKMLSMDFNHAKEKHLSVGHGFKLPFRVGRKQARSVLDANGLEVVVFSKGREDMASKYCELLNQWHNRILTDSMFVKSDTERKYKAMFGTKEI